MLSLYTRELREEAAVGRFHASIAITRETFDAAGGWPLTKRGDFDQTFLKRLAAAAETVDPCRACAPSYVFRWGSIRSYHGQGLMHGPHDVEWYERVSGVGPMVAVDTIVPALGTEAVCVFDTVRRNAFTIINSYNRARM